MVKDNSKWWTHIFSFSGRASRLEYNLVIVCSWIPFYLTDEVTLKAKEYLTLKKDGTFKEFTEYYYDGLMATEECSGKWDIVYDDDLESYFFDQDYKGSLDIKNVSFNANWFKKFDTDKRMIFNGSLTDRKKIRYPELKLSIVPLQCS